jgi:hypothetical protein
MGRSTQRLSRACIAQSHGPGAARAEPVADSDRTVVHVGLVCFEQFCGLTAVQSAPNRSHEGQPADGLGVKVDT